MAAEEADRRGLFGGLGGAEERCCRKQRDSCMKCQGVEVSAGDFHDDQAFQ
jgi:hypothetical protein